MLMTRKRGFRGDRRQHKRARVFHNPHPFHQIKYKYEKKFIIFCQNIAAITSDFRLSPRAKDEMRARSRIMDRINVKSVS